ncbi:hypothetical protein BOX15_Mlig003227g1, partial [Macrostomum lignano]|uniref:Septin n=2 Tax=Macrostomum lignano TaxID=282301 RepID=A0A1I8H1Z8_9PLAT
ASSEVPTLPLSDYVGFDQLPKQEVQKQLIAGFVFNILCVGETGLGKSTLMETLFNRKFNFTPSSNDHPLVKLRSNTFDLQEGHVKLKLTITETSGFGDQLNKEDSAAVILDYINKQYDAYLREEMKAKRDLQAYHDTRVHVCLYFVSPTGHSLKPIDLVTLKALDGQVNIVPLIAKSDTITKGDLQKFKARILSDLNDHGIRVCQFPTDEEEVSEVNAKLNALIPFAVVGGDEPLYSLGAKGGGGARTARGRQYPWGAVCVDDETHCDTAPLRAALLLHNTEHLRQVTRELHYENYRRRRLLELGFSEEDGLSLGELHERQRESLAAAMRSAKDAQHQLTLQRAGEIDAKVERDIAALVARKNAQEKRDAERAARLSAASRALDEEIAEFKRRQKQQQQKPPVSRSQRGGGSSSGGLFSSLK